MIGWREVLSAWAFSSGYWWRSYTLQRQQSHGPTLVRDMGEYQRVPSGSWRCGGGRGRSRVQSSSCGRMRASSLRSQRRSRCQRGRCSLRPADLSDLKDFNRSIRQHQLTRVALLSVLCGYRPNPVLNVTPLHACQLVLTLGSQQGELNQCAEGAVGLSLPPHSPKLIIIQNPSRLVGLPRRIPLTSGDR